MRTLHKVHICVNAEIGVLHLKVCIFSEQWDQTTMKMGSPGNPVCQNASVVVNSFKAAGWDGRAPKTSSGRTLHNPCIFPLHRDWTTNNIANSPRTWLLFQFSQVLLKMSAPQTTENSQEHRIHTSPRGRVGGFCSTDHLMGYRCLSSFRGFGYNLFIMIRKKAKQRD